MNHIMKEDWENHTCLSSDDVRNDHRCIRFPWGDDPGTEEEKRDLEKDAICLLCCKSGNEADYYWSDLSVNLFINWSLVLLLLLHFQKLHQRPDCHSLKTESWELIAFLSPLGSNFQITSLPQHFPSAIRVSNALFLYSSGEHLKNNSDPKCLRSPIFFLRNKICLIAKRHSKDEKNKNIFLQFQLVTSRGQWSFLGHRRPMRSNMFIIICLFVISLISKADSWEGEMEKRNDGINQKSFP